MKRPYDSPAICFTVCLLRVINMRVEEAEPHINKPLRDMPTVGTPSQRDEATRAWMNVIWPNMDPQSWIRRWRLEIM